MVLCEILSPTARNSMVFSFCSFSLAILSCFAFSAALSALIFLEIRTPTKLPTRTRRTAAIPMISVKRFFLATSSSRFRCNSSLRRSFFRSCCKSSSLSSIASSLALRKKSHCTPMQQLF
ncbi:membrane or secreted protein [gut metagenome]|uniref:Membrane or secreted protein n=1 Tax=gut metagenome TaxID=749906 RepID=J9G6V8_9ZZZZ